MKVYIEKNNLQLELIRYSNKILHVYFCEERIRPSHASQEVSNVNHFGSVSDSLGRLAAASECPAS